jgi:hypothetical protein
MFICLIIYCGKELSIAERDVNCNVLRYSITTILMHILDRVTADIA